MKVNHEGASESDAGVSGRDEVLVWDSKSQQRQKLRRGRKVPKGNGLACSCSGSCQFYCHLVHCHVVDVHVPTCCKWWRGGWFNGVRPFPTRVERGVDRGRGGRQGNSCRGAARPGLAGLQGGVFFEMGRNGDLRRALGEGVYGDQPRGCAENFKADDPNNRVNGRKWSKYPCTYWVRFWAEFVLSV